MANEVATELSASDQFHRNLEDRIRESIGDLLPDEVLSEMVKKTLTNVFFDGVPEVKNHYGHVVRPSEPPKLETFVRELMTEAVKDAVSEWLVESDTKTMMVQAVQEAVRGGIYDTMVREFKSRTSAASFSFVNQVMNDVFPH